MYGETCEVPSHEKGSSAAGAEIFFAKSRFNQIIINILWVGARADEQRFSPKGGFSLPVRKYALMDPQGDRTGTNRMIYIFSLTLLCPYFSSQEAFPNKNVNTPSWTRKGTATGS